MARLLRSGSHVWAVTPLLVIQVICSSAALATAEVAAQSPGAHGINLHAGFIAEASQRFAVPARWIKSIIQLESAGDVRAKSSKGAMGLMQIMPDTWAELRLRYGLGDDPYDARDNILAGTAYLAELRDRYGVSGVFAAYNAGPARYERHLAGEPLPAETQAYVSKLASLLGSGLDSSRFRRELHWTAAPFFVARSERNSVPDWQRARSIANGTLAPLGVHTPSSMIPDGTGLFIAGSGVGGAR
ncbi:lytic transglycosylase domain-containing protein [Bradyrhizobium sp. AUGA SZCCT0240]|uniref:lytic transglycosylase domain-containing protein n=1 Tax=Bradyrhizobium sp. AUGA SZCCT0240 TaxID=2807669 RepID=UPI001BA5FAC0|nr:lytic transglycosylase domain-containing protein [Bradyrhizobium sp. AUGA SZCCT0240]MBR1256385.1 lytic transglycosylase domain-containing protein [Bradyrhizobium sp. AUGA SZCCT0240]